MLFRTVDGATCHLPFVYKNVTYDECTTEDSETLWCNTGGQDLVKADCRPGCASENYIICAYFVNIFQLFSQSGVTLTSATSASSPSSSTGRPSPSVSRTRTPRRR